MTDKAPAFQFYARDWLADSKVRQLRLDERGAYVDLLCVQWNEGQVPMDCDLAGQSIGVHHETWPEWRSRIWPKVVTFFPNGRNPRLAAVQAEREAYIEGQRRAGKKGAKNRWSKSHKPQSDNGKPIISPMAKDRSASATASATALFGSKEPAEAAEKWNDRLAPLARQLGPKQVANWLAYFVTCGADTDPVKCDECEARAWGLVWLRDHGALEGMGVRKGDSMKPAIFRSPRADILIRECEAAWRKHGPNAGTDIARSLGVL